eukprot:3726119-Prymnesium_polylepis.1
MMKALMEIRRSFARGDDGEEYQKRENTPIRAAAHNPQIRHRRHRNVAEWKCFCTYDRKVTSKSVRVCWRPISRLKSAATTRATATARTFAFSWKPSLLRREHRVDVWAVKER